MSSLVAQLHNSLRMPRKDSSFLPCYLSEAARREEEEGLCRKCSFLALTLTLPTLVLSPFSVLPR